ncbi:MAG: asparagine synthetase A [Candidatus Heimdallarchaeaceae archaeon]
MKLDTKKSFQTPRYMEILRRDIQASLLVQHVILLESRKILNELKFVEFLAPIIGPATDPGIRGASRVSFDFYGHLYYIMSSIILYKQTLIRSFERIYAFSPNIRLEPASNSDSLRHLCEFYQLDLEMREKTIYDVMNITETFLVELIKNVKETCKDILQEFDRYLKIPSSPFPLVKYSQLYDWAQSNGFSITYGEEIPWDLEESFSSIMKKPFWIIDYPVGSRGFYYKIDPDREGVLLTMDLIYPEGFGEASSGGERETDVNRITSLLKNSKEKVSDYQWFLDMLKKDGKKSSGLGIGIERLTRYILGFKDIGQCSAFPKKPNSFCI